jgi:Arc/MetJ-type ribon-helix-helix transcriptional regulator
MEVALDLAAEDVEFIDAYGQRHGLPSRSAVVRTAIRHWRASELGAAYEEAWQEWSGAGEEDLWQTGTYDWLA